jgi:hypothetical protein
VIDGGARSIQFLSAPDVVGHGVDEIPADDQSPDEVPQSEAAPADDAVNDDPIPEVPLDETSAAPSSDAESPAVDAPADSEAQAGDDDQARDDGEAQAGDGGEAPVGDDFWTGVVTEGSIPTRKVVYGARSAIDDEPETTGWFRSRRRRRR